MAESSSAVPPPKKALNRLLRPWPITLLILSILGASLFGWYRWNYPYGATHRCCLSLYDGLYEWAEEHEGHFPDGGSSSASLSMILGAPFPDTENFCGMVAGKAIDAGKAQSYFKAHHTLSPDLCSWHYVPGLRTDSLPHLALFWDTTGLAHNGLRMKHKAYETVYVGGMRTFIPENQWPAFLNKQAKLLEEERARQLQFPDVVPDANR